MISTAVSLWFGEGDRDLSRDSGAFLNPDVFEGVMGGLELMSDSIHPNDAGYTIMAERFYEAMKPYL